MEKECYTLNDVDLLDYALNIYDTLTNESYCAEQKVWEIRTLTGRVLRDIALNGKV